MTQCMLDVQSVCVCVSERSLQRLALLLDHYDLDVKDLSPEQKDELPAALKQLQLDKSYGHKPSKGPSAFQPPSAPRLTPREPHLAHGFFFFFPIQINMETVLPQGGR